MNGRKAGIVVAVAAAVAVVAVAAVTVLWPDGNGNGSKAQQSAFCWGTLKRDDVAALSVRPLSRYASDEGDLHGSTRADCQVGAGLDAHGVMKRLQFRLTVGGSPENGVWATADDVAGVSPFRAPIAGVPGWVNRSMAGVLLPASCSDRLRFGGAAYVQVKAEGDQDATWRDGALQKRMTDVLMTAATGLARQLGCSEPSFKAPAAAPRLLARHSPAAGKACGLPGFRAPAKYTEEYVTEDGFRLWSCSLGTGTSTGTGGDEVHFTVTQDPHLVRLNDSGAGPWSTTLKCAGKQTLVQAGTDDKALAQEFRTAVARKGSCP
ncbi:hypothetical protein [Streptomyces sp. NPDC002676]